MGPGRFGAEGQQVDCFSRFADPRQAVWAAAREVLAEIP
jgi:hypothetical protein